MSGLLNFLLTIVILAGAFWIAWRMNRPKPKPPITAEPFIVPQPSKPAPGVAAKTDETSGADVSHLYPHSTQGPLFGGDTPGHQSRHAPQPHRTSAKDDKMPPADSGSGSDTDSSSD